MNFSRTLITEKTTFLRYIIWSKTLPCCLLGVRRGVNVAAFPFLWLINLFIQLSEILMPFGLIIKTCWSYSFAFVQKTPYSIALVVTLYCQILELQKHLFHMSLVDLYLNAFSPKATAEPRLFYLNKRYTYPNPQIHWSDFCGWSTDISVKRFFDMMQ